MNPTTVKPTPELALPAHPSWSPQPQQWTVSKPEPLSIVDPLLLIVAIGSAFWSGLMIVKAWERRAVNSSTALELESWKRSSSAVPVFGAHRVPCKQCRYFSNNLYLKCAVRPEDVMTKRAIACADFCTRYSK